jgi:hypothetical protein
MFRKATTALIALLVFCFASSVWADGGAPVGHHDASVKRPVSKMSNRPIGAVNGAARTFAAEKEGASAASPLVPGVRFSRGGSAGKTKPWIKLTAPLGDPVYINIDQIVSVRSDTEISGAKTQVDFTSGKFQRVQEDVEQVMQLISAASDSRGADETSSVALICLGSSSLAPSHQDQTSGDRICEDQAAGM